jgi:hypothetical protein
MFYAAANGKNGLRVFLGVTKENIDEIRADNPLMAQMTHVGGKGLFFLYPSEDNKPSPKFKEVLSLIDSHSSKFPYFGAGIKAVELEALSQNEGFFVADVSDELPGVESIMVFCTNQDDLFRQFKEKGLITDRTEVRHIPRGGVESN